VKGTAAAPGRAAAGHAPSPIPVLFVLLWSTGFIGAKFGLPYAEPMTFLFVRMALVSVLLGAVALAMRAPWPRTWAEAGRIAVAGLLVHGTYLGGVFAAISMGMPAGTSALIVGLQPVLTAAVAGPVLGERVGRAQWLGVALGFAGLLLVLWGKLALGPDALAGTALCVVALLGITAGTIYQKRHCGGMDLRSGTAVQYAASAVAYGLLALALEEREIDWTGEFVFALAWLCLVLSVGAVLLLYVLIRRGSASSVASLFYLVPPCTALVAWALFGEVLTPTAVAGMALTAAGVALANRRPPPPRP
jgi:drug/metabolite transporter (DMT)-like permease